MNKRQRSRAFGQSPVVELVEHRSFLLRLARMQLGDLHDAEDAVQETLIAAADGLAGFSGQVAVRAWLTGILRHKVVDLIRQKQRHARNLVEHLTSGGSSARLSGDDEVSEHDLGEMFTEEGDWNPATFVSTICPRAELERRQQLDLLELCLHLLPEATGRIFLMREYLGMEMDEIASEASIKSGNVRVIVHRARMKLRACIVQTWGENE